MKTIFILSDSLNRRFLSCYGAQEAAITPHIDRLARRSVVFDQAFCGSAPCMPARRDIMTGRLNFLERPWGGIEPFDHTLPEILRSEKNVYSHMETDHFHYSERGGENYWGHFTSWNLHRGTEFDTIYWGPDKGGIPSEKAPKGYVGRYGACYEQTMQQYAGKKDEYSTPRTFTAAADWLERNHDADNFFLWVEGFDPHEPFDVPKEFMDLYEGPEMGESDPYWPDYVTADHYTPEQLAHFRRRYKALVTMTDQYLGKLLNVLDEHDMWEDTMVIFTTDHGFMLGEHNYVAKCYMPDYNEVHHIPFMAAVPGVKPGRSDALVENIDVFPTVLSYFGIDPDTACRNPIHGKSLLPVLYGEQERVRDELLFGVFGKTINVYDGRYVYMRAKAREENKPLYLYGAMMTMMNDYIGLDTMSSEEIDTIEMGRYLPWTNYPVYKVAAETCHWSNNALNFENINNYITGSQLFDLQQDYAQEHLLKDAALEAQMVEKLCRAMAAHDCPSEQYERLGLN